MTNRPTRAARPPAIPLTRLARVIRSKNAGPFELTLDVLFKTGRGFRLARESGVFTRRRIARLYRVRPGDVLGLLWFEPARAVKVTLRRRIPSGAPGDSDIYGAQQHAPLLALTVPEGAGTTAGSAEKGRARPTP